MNRFTLGKIIKFFLHWHYEVRVEGEELLRDDSVHLVLPNHTAYMDPLILFSELWWLPICPMVDELFMRHWLYGRVLRLGDAIEVPDLNKSAMSREEGVAAASQLSRIAIDSLAAGKQICFYPSGHVKTIDREVIGNRRMAYEVCRELPAGVRVILCRMRGLENSNPRNGNGVARSRCILRIIRTNCALGRRLLTAELSMRNWKVGITISKNKTQSVTSGTLFVINHAALNIAK